jgi:hypothetical protein
MTPKRTTESGWKIPQDWDGETWRCVTLRWPDSIDFERMLFGMLYDLTRGRTYDKFTGSLVAAQEMGWKIWDKNIPLAACTDCPDCEECPPDRTECPSGRGGGLIILGDETMANGGGVVTGIEITDEGKLRVYYGHCCYDDLDIPATGGESSVDPVNPDGGDTNPYSACGKADAVVGAIWLLIQRTFDVCDDIDIWPWQIIGTIEDAMGVDLDNNWMTYLAVNCAGALAIDKTADDILTDFDKQSIICKLAEYFSDDAIGVPDYATFQEIKGIFKSVIFMGNWVFFDQALNAIGTHDLDTIAKWGADKQDADCDCPGEDYFPAETEPGENGWYLSVDHSDEVVYVLNDAETAKLAYWIGDQDQDVFGVWFKIDVAPSYGETKRENQTQCKAEYAAWIDQDVNVSPSSSDNLQSTNQSYPLVQCAQSAVMIELEIGRGVSGATQFTGGVDDCSNPASSSEWTVGQTGGFILRCSGETIPDGYITELRFIMNTNSPSHSS